MGKYSGMFSSKYRRDQRRMTNMLVNGFIVAPMKVAAAGAKAVAKSASSSSHSSSSSRGTPLQGQYDFTINDDGTVIFYNHNGSRIYDESLIRRLKSTEQFKEKRNRILEQRKQEKQQKFEREQNAKFHDIQNETASITSIHKHSPIVFSQSERLSSLSNVRPREYTKEEFQEPVPMREHIKLMLSEEAERTVQAPFWKRNKAIDEYVESRVDVAYNEALMRYEEKRHIFDEGEAKKAESMNKKYEEEAENRKKAIRLSMNNDEKYIDDAIISWIENVDTPIDFTADFEYIPQNGFLSFDLYLPSINEMPTEKAVKLASGEVKAKPKTQKEIKQDYIFCVFGLALFASSNLFNVNTSIKNMIISGYSPRRDDTTGNIVNDCIFSLKIPRSQIEGVDISSKDPQQFALSFENSCNITTSLIMKPIQPFEKE